MLKLFKYEWKKQMFSKLVIGCILLVLALFYVLGVALKKDGWAELVMVLLVMTGMFASIYAGIECLLVLDRDIRTKESHMLFMIPKPAYQILGAKILAAVCQIFLTMVMFGAAFAVCFTAYMAANQSIAEILDYLRSYAEELLDLRIRWGALVEALASMFLQWINVIASGFAAIISVRTVLSRTKLAGLIAFVVFVLLNWGTGWLLGKINGLSANAGGGMLYYWLSLAASAVITVVLLVFSGWLAEKKLSV